MIVCDFSQAILISVAKVFADKRNLREYMQTCYDILKGNCTILPSTYIRLDISHIVAIVCRWECLRRHSLIKVRQFFIRSICHAYKMENLENLEYFVECILTVALSQTLGSSMEKEKELQSQVSFNFVNNVIKGTADFSELDEQCSTLDEVDLNIECPTGWTEWSKAIYDRAVSNAKMCTQGDTLNACFNVNVAKKIRKMLHYTPILTSVMLPFYNTGTVVATSSSVETEFSNIKNRVFKGDLPLRVDKFIFRHFDYLDGRIKESMAKCITLSKKKQKKQIINSLKNTTKKRAQESNFIDSIAIDEIIKETDTVSLHDEECVSKVTSLDYRADKEKEKVETDSLSQSNFFPKLDFVDADNADDSLNQKENWGDLNDEPKKRRKPTYLDACPEWNIIQSHKNIVVSLLKNGSL